jgi:hypothetical protein
MRVFAPACLLAQPPLLSYEEIGGLEPGERGEGSFRLGCVVWSREPVLLPAFSSWNLNCARKWRECKPAAEL